MGKNKTKSKDKEHHKHVETEATASCGIAKSENTITKKLSAVVKSVGMPESADGLTADQLTENQKHALKKVCAGMYGHKHTVKRALPANSLEAASAQLADKLKAKLAERKKEKKRLKK